MKLKTKSNAAFIAKLKTLSIKGHHKPPVCKDCCHPMQIMGVGISIVRQESKPKEERSFAE